MTQPVLAIGNFDGVHKGHQALLHQAKNFATASQAPLWVLTFDPHPRQFFVPTAPPFLLTTLAQRLALLAECGVDNVLVENFDTAFSRLTAQKFIDAVLIKKINAQSIFVGADFKFGSQRTGNVALLQQLGLVVPPIKLEQDVAGTISATRIRQLLQQGQVAQANTLLGRPWQVQGVVQQGAQRGRTLGFPTANIAWPQNLLVPSLGVYAGVAVLPHGQKYKAVANTGTRPTVNQGFDVRLEVHLLNYTGDLYGAELVFEVQHFIRPEQKFDSLDALKAQIQHDVREVLSRESAL